MACDHKILVSRHHTHDATAFRHADDFAMPLVQLGIKLNAEIRPSAMIEAAAHLRCKRGSLVLIALLLLFSIIALKPDQMSVVNCLWPRAETAKALSAIYRASAAKASSNLLSASSPRFL
jgi:hypothetical protein